MPTSVPGSRRHRTRRPVWRACGFTLIELLLVIAILALGVALVGWAVPDREAARLDEEGERLSALLERARAEARVAGAQVIWVPRSEAAADAEDGTAPAQFRFLGLPAAMALPTRWLDARTTAEVVGANAVLLGPEAILPAQRIVLHLDAHRLELASDGLAPFAAVAPTPQTP